MVFHSFSLPISTLSSVLCLKLLQVQKRHTQHFSFSMIRFLQPYQNKHSINCSFLRHKTKSHFVNCHFCKTFANTLSITLIPCSRCFTALQQLLFLMPSHTRKLKPLYIETIPLAFTFLLGLSDVTQPSIEFQNPC